MALIDIASDSVAGGYVRYEEGKTPEILYAKRVSIERGRIEAALAALGEMLTREGAPVLARITGSGSVASVLVSVGAPWQETRVRTERLQGKGEFTFTSRILADALTKEAIDEGHRILADEIVVGTILNGYETKRPLGKRVSEADVIILASFIDREVAEVIARALRRLYHTREIRLASASALRYEALRRAFPHQKSYLIVDAGTTVTDITLVRRGLLAGVDDERAGSSSGTVSVLTKQSAPGWCANIEEGFNHLAKQQPLPHTIFLLTSEAARASCKQDLEKMPFASLWLSNDPPTVIPLAPSQIPQVRFGDGAIPDLPLALLALSQEHHV